jgi:hypothetical protein
LYPQKVVVEIFEKIEPISLREDSKDGELMKKAKARTKNHKRFQS